MSDIPATILRDRMYLAGLGTRWKRASASVCQEMNYLIRALVFSPNADRFQGVDNDIDRGWIPDVDPGRAD
jgi:hypothetical protein